MSQFTDRLIDNNRHNIELYGLHTILNRQHTDISMRGTQNPAVLLSGKALYCGSISRRVAMDAVLDPSYGDDVAVLLAEYEEDCSHIFPIVIPIEQLSEAIRTENLDSITRSIQIKKLGGEQVDATPWYESTTYHPISKFFCAYTSNDSQKLEHLEKYPVEEIPMSTNLFSLRRLTKGWLNSYLATQYSGEFNGVRELTLQYSCHTCTNAVSSDGGTSVIVMLHSYNLDEGGITNNLEGPFFASIALLKQGGKTEVLFPNNLPATIKNPEIADHVMIDLDMIVRFLNRLPSAKISYVSQNPVMLRQLRQGVLDFLNLS